MCPITHSSDPQVVSCTFRSTSLFGSSLLKDLNFLTAPPHEKMNETAYVDLPERYRQLNQQILCYEKLSQLHQARAPVRPSGPDLLNGEAPEKIERKVPRVELKKRLNHAKSIFLKSIWPKHFVITTDHHILSHSVSYIFPMRFFFSDFPMLSYSPFFFRPGRRALGEARCAARCAR